ncbi:MAG: hypothetical protein HYZ53_28145 [Planctomycetes bacterium]|nr:hypothetical protein [Planctomycetota bacterium]
MKHQLGRLPALLLVLLPALLVALACPSALACTPEGVQATAGETQVSLSWSHPEPVTYKVLRSEHVNYGFSVIATTTAETFLDTNLPPRTYYYVIVAVEGEPPLEYRSATVSATPTDNPPPAPAFPTLKFSINLWTLEWDMPSVPPDLAGFNVYKTLTPNAPWTRMNGALLPPTTRQFIGSAPKSRMYVRIGSVDRTGHESFSIEKTINPGDFHAKHPNAHDPIPTGLTATGGETIADLAWDPLAGSFYVYRSTASGAGYVQIGSATSNSYQDTGLAAGTYYYVVTSVDGEPPIESPYSNEASATVTDAAPPAAESLAVGLTPDTYQLTWSLLSVPPDLAGARVWKSWTAGGPYTPASPGLVNSMGPFSAARPRAPLFLKVSMLDAAGQETMSTEEVSVEPADLVREEPKLNASRLGAGAGAEGSVTATGGELLWDEETLSSRVEVGFGFSFHRVYRSGSAHDTGLGHGWSHTWEQYLTASGADFERFDGSRNRTDRYTWDAEAQVFVSPAGFYDRLEANPDGSYKITDRDGTVCTFALAGGSWRLTQKLDRNGNTLTIAYEGGRVSAVTDSRNHTVSFVYGGDGRLSSLSDPYGAQAPRTVSFVYSAEGDLAQVTDLLGFPRTYVYAKDQPHDWLNHNLLSCKDGKGQTYLVVSYDEDTDRVLTQQYGSATQVYRFSYAPAVPDGGIRMVERRGEGFWRLETDAGGHVTQQIFEAPGLGLTWSWTLNADGERTLQYNSAGDGESWAYDTQNADPLKRGNLLEHRWIGSGMPADKVETWTYLAGSPWSLVKTHTDHHGVMLTYFYDLEEAGGGDLNGDGVTSQAAGNVVKIVHPTVTLGQPSPQVIEEKFWFDGSGRRTRAINPNGRATKFEYVAAGPSAGYLERVIEDEGGLNLTTSWTLDAAGNVTSTTSPRQNTLVFDVNRANQLNQIDGPLGYQIKFLYDENGRLVERRVKNLDGDGVQDASLPWFVTSYTHSVLGDVLSETQTVTGSQSSTKTFAYDADQNLLSVTSAGGRVDSFQREARGLVSRHTQGEGSAHPIVREFQYDARGSVNSMSWASGYWAAIYDGFGRRTLEITLGVTARKYTYDPDCPGNDSASGQQQGTYSPCGGGFSPATSQSKKDDENHRPYQTDSVHNDSQGNPVAGGTSTQSAVQDANGNVTQVTTASGGTLTISHDGAGRATAVFRPAASGGGGGGQGGGDGGGGTTGDGVSSVLDADGNPTLLTMTAENTATGVIETRLQEREYDPYGGVTTIIDDPGAGGANLTTHLKHDSRGNVVEVTDPQGNHIKRTFDGLGNVRTHVYQPAAGPTITLSFEYNVDGALTSLTDGLGHTTTYTRDVLGHVTQILYPNQTTETFEYDGNGWPSRHTDANGTVADMLYNSIGLPTQRSITPVPGVEGTSSETIYYDGALRPIFLSGETGHTTLSYTTLSRVDQCHRSIYDSPGIADTSFEFNAAGDRTRMTYPNGRVLDFTRDNHDRLRQVRDGATVLAAYDYAGQATSRRVYANGLKLEVSRDALFRVTNWQHVQGAGTLRAGWVYAYDELGQKKYEHSLHDGLADVYGHDGLGQLTGVKHGVPAADVAPGKDYADYATYTSRRDYDFDAAGNRKTVDSDGLISYYNYVNGLYVPDLANRIQTIDDTSRTHDANGNVTDDGTNTYTYNWRNQVVRAYRKSDGLLIAHYTYDAVGRRERKYTIDASGVEVGWVDFVHDGNRIIAERDATGAYLATFVNGNGIDEVLSVDRGGERYFLHEDAQGSVRLVTDAAGTNVEKYEYTEYGLPTVYAWDAQAGGGAGAWAAGVVGGASTIGNTRMFTGREWDAELGWYYYRARHYDPKAGRFVSPDPIGYTGDTFANTFRYVGNAPWDRRDPLGFGWLEGIGEGLLGVAAAAVIAAGFVIAAPAFPIVAAVTGVAMVAAGGYSLGTDIYEAVSGEDAVTGESISDDERETRAGRALVGGLAMVAGGNKTVRTRFKNKVEGLTGRGGGGAPAQTEPTANTGASPKPCGPPMQPKAPNGPTTGLLSTDQGEVGLVSGREGPAQAMPRGSPGFDAYTRTHVEGHAAALMRQTGATSGFLDINNPEICPNCARNLPAMLAEGSALTVRTPSGATSVFVGAKPR